MINNDTITININRKGYSNNKRIVRKNSFENIKLDQSKTQEKFIVIENKILKEIAVTFDREEYSQKLTNEELKQITYVLEIGGWIMDTEMLSMIKAHLLAGGKLNSKLEEAVKKSIKFHSNEDKEQYAKEICKIREEFKAQLNDSKERITKESIKIAVKNGELYTKNQTRLIRITSFIAGTCVTILIGTLVVLICIL